MGDNAIVIQQKEVPTVQTGEPIDQILAMAIQQGAPLEQLSKWMDLKRQHEADEARKAFFKAVAAFKREEIRVSKDKVNNQFGSKYTTLGNLLETVNPYLGKHGLSVSFIPSQADKMVTVECVLRHELGHTESVTLSAPPDTSGGNSKNPIQQIKSTFTYLRSATFEAVTGLSGTDASIDDDGNSANPIVPMSPDHLDQLEIMCQENGVAPSVELPGLSLWLTKNETDDIKAVPDSYYGRAVSALNGKFKQMAAQNGNN